MKFAASIPGMTLYPGGVEHWWADITPQEIVRIGRRIEELGYDWIIITTHIVMNRESAAEMGTRWVHSLTAAGFVFGATTNVRVMPLIVVPNHNPIECAKMISTLDFLSAGRVTPTLLLGYKEYEFDLLRVPYEPRKQIMEEYIAAMHELWYSDDPRFEGEFVSFDDVVFDPRPVQDPIPLHFGGASKAAQRWIAQWGAGWFTSSWVPRAKLKESLEYIYGRPEYQANPRPLDVSLGIFEGKRDLQTHRVLEQPTISFDKDVVLEEIATIASLGATYADADDLLGIGRFQNAEPGAPAPVRSAEEFLDRLQWFAEEIMPEARKIEATAPVSA